MQPYAVGAFFFTPYILIVFFACLFGTLFIKSCLFYPGVCVLYISWELSLINSARCELNESNGEKSFAQGPGDMGCGEILCWKSWRIS